MDFPSTGARFFFFFFFLQISTTPTLEFGTTPEAALAKIPSYAGAIMGTVQF